MSDNARVWPGAAVSTKSPACRCPRGEPGDVTCLAKQNQRRARLCRPRIVMSARGDAGRYQRIVCSRKMRIVASRGLPVVLRVPVDTHSFDAPLDARQRSSGRAPPRWLSRYGEIRLLPTEITAAMRRARPARTSGCSVNRPVVGFGAETAAPRAPARSAQQAYRAPRPAANWRSASTPSPCPTRPNPASPRLMGNRSAYIPAQSLPLRGASY